MIITKTPFRMSFFGGGTDMQEFFSRHNGAVISTTFDKYCYVTVRHLPPFFDYASELVYSHIERVSTQSDIEHPAIREAMKLLDMHDIRLTYEADLPARTGLGTSSSFALGMLNAFHTLKGQYIDKRKLADEAIYLERTLCKETGGWQDQIAAAFGGLNRIEFSNGGYSVTPIIISKERKQLLNDNLLLFFTGFARCSSDIQRTVVSKISDNTDNLLAAYELVNEAEHVLQDHKRDLDEFGGLLDKAWQLKRQQSDNISTSHIDTLYKTAVSAGALGGKLLGAGGGGFLLFYVVNGKRQNVLNALGNLMNVPFRFENTGTQVLYYAPEEYTF
jgi:D-glycero-alpha-D-manno-heptose-7-phosphate kinase